MVFDHAVSEPVRTPSHPMSEYWLTRGESIFTSLKANKAVLEYRAHHNTRPGATHDAMLYNIESSGPTVMMRVAPDLYVSRPAFNQGGKHPQRKRSHYQLTRRDQAILGSFDFALSPRRQHKPSSTKVVDYESKYSDEHVTPRVSKTRSQRYRASTTATTARDDLSSENSGGVSNSEFSVLVPLTPMNDTTFATNTPIHGHSHNKRYRADIHSSDGDLSTLHSDFQSVLMSESSVLPSVGSLSMDTSSDRSSENVLTV